MSSRVNARTAVDAVPWWYHSIDLGDGIVTPGWVPANQLREMLTNLRLPPLDNKTVLDIGSWDGYFAFAAERLGASRVVALDHFAWYMNIDGWVAHVSGLRESGVTPTLYDYLQLMDTEALPGKKGFDTARAVLGSKVEAVVEDFMEMDLDSLGTFDVVLFLGVLYHLRDPLRALERVAALTREQAVIETAAVYTPGLEHKALCEFWEGYEYGEDPSNWWAPNARALEALCRTAGFRSVDVIVGPPDPTHLPTDRPTVFRAIAHAFK